MDVTPLVLKYGYLIVFLGSFVEGELIVITAGIFAFQGLLNIYLVMFFAFLGTTLSEQLLFQVGYHYGNNFITKLANVPLLNKFINTMKIKMALRLLTRHQRTFILSCRFMPGIRTISPMLIGSAKIRPGLFSLYNVIAASIWAVISTGIGYSATYITTFFHLSNAIHWIMIVVYVCINLIVMPSIMMRMMRVYAYDVNKKKESI